MARMATRIASGLAAAGIATLMSTAPAQARRVDPEAGCTGVSCIGPTTPAPEATPWLKIALGTAGGVALAGSGAATVSSRKRNEQQRTGEQGLGIVPAATGVSSLTRSEVGPSHCGRVKSSSR